MTGVRPRSAWSTDSGPAHVLCHGYHIRQERVLTMYGHLPDDEMTA
jgi:hypothetical protein